MVLTMSSRPAYNCSVIGQPSASETADGATTTTGATEIIPGGKLNLATHFSGSKVRILFTSTGDTKI